MKKILDFVVYAESDNHIAICPKYFIVAKGENSKAAIENLEKLAQMYFDDYEKYDKIRENNLHNNIEVSTGIISVDIHI